MPQDPFLKSRDQLKPQDPFLKPQDPFKGQQAKPQVGLAENVLYRTGVGALRDTAQATAELVEDAGGLVGAEFDIPDLPKVPQPTYTGGGLVRDVAGFLVPYTGAVKATKFIAPATTAGKVAKTTSLGAAAEQFAFSPDEERLSNLVQSYPLLENPVTEFLQADSNDSVAEGRFKMALEGAGLGLAVEGVLKGLGRIKGSKNVAEEIEGVDAKVETPEPIKVETPEPTPDFAGNINLTKVDSPDEVKNIIKDIANDNNNFTEATRGVVKFGSDGEELRALAKETGLDEERLLKRKTGEAFNAETSYAARVLNINSAKNLVQLAKKATGKNRTPQDLINLEEGMTRHTAIQEQVAGITAEAGRALRGFREIAKSTGAVQERAIKEFIKQKGGDETIEAIAEAMSKLDSPSEIAKFSSQAFKATTRDQVQEFWINSLLSSPSTHLVNVLSNALVATSRIPEYGIATVLGAARKGADKVTPTEFGARVLGNVYGALDGLRAFGKAIIDPETITDPLTKLELQRQKSINTPLKIGNYDLIGDTVRLPGRFLTAEDALFKGIGYRQELWGQAIRQSKKEGQGIKRAFEILENPEKNFPDIHLKSQDIARYQTFTNPLGESAQKIQDLLIKHPSARFIIPFFRTPVNIVKYAGQRTPLGRYSKTYKEAIKKGGAEADLARARVIFGSSVMGAIAYLASNNLVTGRGPSDFRKRRILQETGWQPYSLKIGDSYYGYNRFEPAGILFGLAADSVEIANYISEEKSKGDAAEFDKLAGMLGSSVSMNLTNKTFLSGITSAINAISDPDRYAEGWVKRFASSFVPTAVYYVRKSDDPLIRDAQTLTDAFYNRIPTMSQQLPARRNVLGEPIEYTSTYSPEILGNIGKTFSPIQKSTITNDVVFNELARLKITPSTPSRKIGSVKLEPKQYEGMLKEMLSLGTKRKLENVIKSSNYQSVVDSVKTDLIKSIILEDQKIAREVTQIRNHDIITNEILNLMQDLKQN